MEGAVASEQQNKEFIWIISVDNGNWYPAKIEQINTVNSFLRRNDDVHPFINTFSPSNFYNIRPNNSGQSNR